MNCYVCEKKFNAKCFDLSSQWAVLLRSTTNNAFFMCHKCIDRVNKVKNNLRKSTDAVPNVQPTRNADGNSDSHLSHRDKAIFSDMLDLLKKMDENFAYLISSNDEIKRLIPAADHDRQAGPDVVNEFSKLNQNVTNLHAKIDHGFATRSSFESEMKSTVMRKLNTLDEKARVPQVAVTPRGVAHNESISKAIPSSDPLNWSFSFNHSLLHDDNSELFRLLHGFERNTWTSFDYLNRKLSENTDAVLQIESVVKELNLSDINQRLKSPVVDSITLDNLQLISDKCDVIRNDLLEIGSDFKSIHGTSNRDEQSTQQLRNRLMNLIDNDEECVNRTENDRSDHSDTELSTDGHQERVNRSVTTDIGLNSSDTVEFNPDLRRDLQIFEPLIDTNATSRKQLHLLGSNVQTPAFDHHFHISPFDVHVSPENIIDYIAENSLKCKSGIRIRRLVKNGQNLSELNYVTFKIETSSDIGDVISRSSFWPRHIVIKPWINKCKKTSPSSFLDNRPT